jgi:hypothetical protein
MDWTGMAIMVLGDTHPSRAEGYIGAFAAVACRAERIVDALRNLSDEFERNDLVLIGIENFISTEMLDRSLTGAENELLSALQRYPVQFNNVHLHKGDG